MHNNYYFLRQLSQQLSETIKGWQLAVCFSQNKDELILGFFNPAQTDSELYIKAHLDPSFCCLHFPADFKRSRKNNVDLFHEIIGQKVSGIRQFLNERSFAIQFENEDKSFYQLLFKMHGNRSNILLYHHEKVVSLFKSSLQKDEDLALNMLDKSLDFSYEAFVEKEGKIQALYPTFGVLVKIYLEQQQYNDLAIDAKWQLVQQVLDQLENPKKYYITELQDTLYLSLLETGNVQAAYDAPVEAINHFFIQYIRTAHLGREKNEVMKALQKQRSQAQHYIKTTEQKLSKLQQGTRPDELANIIMAYMHQIPARATEAELHNFYTDQPIKIKLKKDLSPQKNAEVYYRKAKNQKIEEEQLASNIAKKYEQLEEVEEHLAALQPMEDVRELRQYLKEHELQKNKQQQEQDTPYRQFEIEGFTVLVGKSTKSNDELVRTYSWKEDLWLHAKDVAGSHVIIKHQAGKPFPKSVIEKSAQLAAYYSKRKSDSLCPVSVTPRKFIRRSKDLAPGQVIIDREDTILVEPALNIQ